MNIEFEGESYTLDLDEIDVSEARTIKRQTGMSLIKFQEGIYEVDPDSLILAYWLMMKQSGKPAVDPQKVNFKIVKFSNAIVDAIVREKAEAEEHEKAEEANPTEEPVVGPEPTS